MATWSFSLIYWVLSFSTSRQSWYYRLCIKAYVQPISQLMHLDLTIFFQIKDGSPFVLYFIWESSHLCCLLGTNKAGYITLPSVGFSYVLWGSSFIRLGKEKKKRKRKKKTRKWKIELLMIFVVWMRKFENLICNESGFHFGRWYFLEHDACTGFIHIILCRYF